MKRKGLSGKYGRFLRRDALWMIRPTADQDQDKCSVSPSPWSASSLISHPWRRMEPSVILALAVKCNRFPKEKGATALEAAEETRQK